MPRMTKARLTCPVCETKTHDQYMVYDDLWKSLGLVYEQNVHIRCLNKMCVKKIGRPLKLSDFPQSAVINDVLHYAARNL